jgi:hypothetical protein
MCVCVREYTRPVVYAAAAAHLQNKRPLFTGVDEDEEVYIKSKFYGKSRRSIVVLPTTLQQQPVIYSLGIWKLR